MKMASRVFLSYAWSSDDYQQTIDGIARALNNEGFDLIFDQWDLRAGYDVDRFMEQICQPDVGKIVVFCNAMYRLKADERKGGVAYESRLIRAIQASESGEGRVIPVVLEKGVDGVPCVPRWLLRIKYIDLTPLEELPKKLPELIAELGEKSRRPERRRKPEESEAMNPNGGAVNRLFEFIRGITSRGGRLNAERDNMVPFVALQALKMVNEYRLRRLVEFRKVQKGRKVRAGAMGDLGALDLVEMLRCMYFALRECLGEDLLSVSVYSGRSGDLRLHAMVPDLRGLVAKPEDVETVVSKCARDGERVLVEDWERYKIDLGVSGSVGRGASFLCIPFVQADVGDVDPVVVCVSGRAGCIRKERSREVTYIVDAFSTFIFEYAIARTR